jgi:large conductance mechanosensitive channel
MNSKTLSPVQEFVGFIKKYGVIGLALGVVVGGAVKEFVDTLVTTLINPIVALVIPDAGQLDTLWIVGGKTVNGVVEGGFRFGEFIGASINFLVLMLVIFIVMKVFISRFVSDDELEKV